MPSSENSWPKYGVHTLLHQPQFEWLKTLEFVGIAIMQSSTYQKFLKEKLCWEIKIASTILEMESPLMGIIGNVYKLVWFDF